MPPSPKQPRFLDGKKENVAAVPSAPGRPAPEARAGRLRGVLEHRHAERLDLGDRARRCRTGARRSPPSCAA